MSSKHEKLVRVVMSPKTSFRAALTRMQNEVYQCVTDLERIEEWGRKERKGARAFLQKINTVIHDLEKLFNGFQIAEQKASQGGDNNFWTARDVAEYLGCSEQTVRDKTYRHRIPSIKIPGGGRRYRKEDIDKWILGKNSRMKK